MIHDQIALLMHGFAQFRDETARLPLPVLAWMWVMRIVLGASIAFLPRPGALATLGAMVATAVSRFYIKGLYPDMPAAQIGATVHIVLWAPLAIFLLHTLRARRRTEGSAFERAYAIWLVAATAVMAVSLAFDVREVAAAVLAAR